MPWWAKILGHGYWLVAGAFVLVVGIAVVLAILTTMGILPA